MPRETREIVWDEAAAAHLLRRAGFGGTPQEIERACAQGLEATVDELVDFPPEDPELDQRIEDCGWPLTPLEGIVEGSGRDVRNMSLWWLFRMIYGSHPLQEKLALFWHDHFACRADVAGPSLMRAQNDLFRRLGAATFGELLLAVAKDPAMLEFLDGRENVAENPNENFARELLELFTLGVDRYAQEDVYAVARVFTGWSTPSKDSLEFAFRPKHHDDGDKVIFGEVLRGRKGAGGVHEGEELLERLLQRPECADFLAGKLLRWFVHLESDEQSQDFVAERLSETGFSVRETLRSLFLAPWFYADRNRWSLFKNPVEVVVGASRALGIQNAHLMDLDRQVELMGMRLFEPPSVAGWDDGESWVQTGYLVERLNFAHRLSSLPLLARSVIGSAALDARILLPQPDLRDEDLVRSLERRLLQQELGPKGRALIVDQISSEANALAKHGEQREKHKLRSAIHLVMSTPQFALA